jgi:hypothetical protein
VSSDKRQFLVQDDENYSTDIMDEQVPSSDKLINDCKKITNIEFLDLTSNLANDKG